MRMWANQILEFQYAIWNKLRHGATVEETEHNKHVCADVASFIHFRFLGFWIIQALGQQLLVVKDVVVLVSLMMYKDNFIVVIWQVMVSRFNLLLYQTVFLVRLISHLYVSVTLVYLTCVDLITISPLCFVS